MATKAFAVGGELGGIGKTRACTMRQQRERIVNPADSKGWFLRTKISGASGPSAEAASLSSTREIRDGKIGAGTKQAEIEIRFLAAEKGCDAKPAIALHAEAEQGDRSVLPVLGGDEERCDLAGGAERFDPRQHECAGLVDRNWRKRLQLRPIGFDRGRSAMDFDLGKGPTRRFLRSRKAPKRDDGIYSITLDKYAVPNVKLLQQHLATKGQRHLAIIAKLIREGMCMTKRNR